ncbi:MAG: bile acid:sodium symporter family protein [Pseudomonadota bacterium]
MDAAALDQISVAMNPASQAGLAAALMLIMFSVALGLKPADFAAIAKAPRPYVAGVIAQVIGLPLMTLCLVFALAPAPSIAFGMIVVAACPGGNISNLLTFLGRGEVALSVAMTATSSLVAAFLTPSLILFWSSLYPPTAAMLEAIEFNAVDFLVQTTALLALPLMAGMATARFAPKLAARLRGPGAVTGGVLILILVIAGLYGVAPRLLGAAALIMPPVIIHNTLGFVLGAGAARVSGAAVASRRAITFEVGIQNSGLALVILLSQFDGLGGAAAIAATWGVWHLLVGGAMVALYRRLDRQIPNGRRPLS